MEYGEGKVEPGVRVELSEKQKSARRLRNIAIGVCLGTLVLAFYGATLVKIGPQVMNRPIISLDNL